VSIGTKLVEVSEGIPIFHFYVFIFSSRRA